MRPRRKPGPQVPIDSLQWQILMQPVSSRTCSHLAAHQMLTKNFVDRIGAKTIENRWEVLMRNITSLAATLTLSLAMLSPFHTLSAENEGLEGSWNVVVTPNALFLCNGPKI